MYEKIKTYRRDKGEGKLIYDDERLRSEGDLRGAMVDGYSEDEYDYEYNIDEEDVDLNLRSGSLLEDSQILGDLDEADLDSLENGERSGRRKSSVGHDTSKYRVTGETVDLYPKVTLEEVEECLLIIYKESLVAPTGFNRFLSTMEGKDLLDDNIAEGKVRPKELPLYIYTVTDETPMDLKTVEPSVSVQRVVSHVHSPEALVMVITKIGENKSEKTLEWYKAKNIDIKEPSTVIRHYVDKTIKPYHQFKLGLDYRH